MTVDFTEHAPSPQLYSTALAPVIGGLALVRFAQFLHPAHPAPYALHPAPSILYLRPVARMDSFVLCRLLPYALITVL
jgi:hypothetical protein